jgi:hypothetical protein
VLLGSRPAAANQHNVATAARHSSVTGASYPGVCIAQLHKHNTKEETLRTLHRWTSRLKTATAFGTVLLTASGVATATPPTIFSQANFESPVRADPGDLLLLPGDGFSATDVVVYQSVSDTTQPLVAPTSIPTTNTATSGVATVVSTLNLPHSLTVSVPAVVTADQSYALWAVDSAGEWSNGIEINDARPVWFTPDLAYSTVELASLPRYLKIVGRNLVPAPGATTQVRLTGPATYTLNASNDGDPSTAIERYAAIVPLPATMAVGTYNMQISRDGVSWVAVTGTNTSPFQVLPDPAAPPTFDVSDSAYGGCSGNDGNDDTACIVAAVNAARAAGGGNVYFPPGTWHMGNMSLPGVVYYGVLVPLNVNLVGAGASSTTIVKDTTWGLPCPIFTVQGYNTVAGITFLDARNYTSQPGNRGIIELGIDPVNAQAYHAGDPTILSHVVITNDVFSMPYRAIQDSVGGMPIDHLYITFNTFGAFQTDIIIDSDTNLADTVIAYNTFYPSSYVDIAGGQGPIPTQLSAGHRLDFSDNVADGTATATRYLYNPATDATGFRAAYFWSLMGNHEGVLIAENTALCSGDKAGDGEAVAFDGASNLAVLPSMQPALTATTNTVAVQGPLVTQSNGTAYPAGYFIGYWVTVAQGPGAGQTRRIVSYSGTSPITFTVSPAWDVPPQVTSQVTIEKQFWQVYVVDNYIDQRLSSGCTKANPDKPSGGTITLAGQTTHAVIEGNRQYDTSGIGVDNGYTVTDPQYGTVPNDQFHHFTEIRGNTISGEYDWQSYCSFSGIQIEYSAGPTAGYPPPPEAYGISVSHNTVTQADGFHDGAITFSRGWYGGPAPDATGWDAVESALVFDNSISNITLPPPGPVTPSPWLSCAQSQSSRIGSHIEDGMAWHTVYAQNSCSNVANNFLDGGTQSQRVCTDAPGNSCECPAALAGNSTATPSAVTSLATAYPGAQNPGDLNVIVVTWHGIAQAPTVADTSGNTYYRVPSVLNIPTSVTGASTNIAQAIYYSSGIAGGSSNTVTATWKSTVIGTSLQVFEYSGIDTTSSTLPLDVYTGNSGTGSSADSNWFTTTNGNDLIFSAALSGGTSIGPGVGYSARLTSSGPTGRSLAEDETVTVTGAFHATALVTPSSWWGIQAIAFRLAGGGGSNTQGLTTPNTLAATAAAGDTVNLSWTGSTDNLGAGVSYLVERCAGASCSNFAQIASVTSGTSYTDSGLTSATTYSYRVRATDPAGILTPYTSTVTATATP